MNVIQTNSTKEYSVESGISWETLHKTYQKDGKSIIDAEKWKSTGFAFENERGSFVEFSCEGQLTDVTVSKAVLHYLASKKSAIDDIELNLSYEPEWKEYLLSQFDKAIAKQLQKEADEFWLR